MQTDDDIELIIFKMLIAYVNFNIFLFKFSIKKSQKKYSKYFPCSR